MRTGCLLSRVLMLSALAVPLVALAGCAGHNPLDPYQKSYTWHPTGAAAANIAAQVVDPHDLVAGRGTTREGTHESTLAIQHIWTDTPKPFISETGGSAGGAGASGAGPGASGGSAGGSGGSSGGSN